MRKEHFFTRLSLICFLLFMCLVIVACQEEVFSVALIFDNGEMDQTIEVYRNDTLPEPEMPSRYGYIFAGWFVDDAYYNFNNPIVSDLTIIAKWHISVHHLSFLDYLGKTLYEDSIPYGSDISSLIPTAPLVIGYTFRGWSTYIHDTMPNEDLLVSANYDLYEGFAQRIIWEDETIIKVETNEYSNAILTDEGKVFMWGRNEAPGMLCGVYDGSYDTLTPVDITDAFDLNENEKIIDIYLGIDKNIVITSQNRFFEWGGCYKCNLGQCPSDSLGYPKDITDIMLIPGEVMKSFEYWQGNFAIITESEKIYTKGHINYGQFKEDVSTTNQWLDQTDKFNLEPSETITEIHLGLMHSGALTSNGRLLMWGNNFIGALGAGTDIDKSSIPLDITNKFDLNQGEEIVQFQIGRLSTAVLTNLGRVYTFGSNAYGMLGVHNLEEIYEPLDVTQSFILHEGERITKIKLPGTTTIVATTNQSRVFGWGYNVKDQLTESEDKWLYIPVDITDHFDYDQASCIDFVIGLEHIIMVKMHEIVISGNKTFDLEA